MSDWWTYAESTVTASPKGHLSERSGCLNEMGLSWAVLSASSSLNLHDRGQTYGGPGTLNNMVNCECHPPAMGHQFNDKLMCGERGRAWWAQALEPKPCPGERPPRPKPKRKRRDKAR